MNAPEIDEIEVHPLAGTLDADVVVPGSRSLTNRALVCAALADGHSTLRGALAADDTEAMTECLTTLGAEITRDGDVLEVSGTAGVVGPGPAKLFTRLSGTTSRFVLPLLAIGHGTYTLDGAAPMRRRPMGDGIIALRDLGVDIDDADGHLPVVVHANGLAGGSISVRGDASSQFLSGLLLAGAAMSDGLQLQVIPPLKSVPYIEMTAGVMGAFGAAVTEADDCWTVTGGGYVATDHAIEPDASTACYFLAAAAIRGGRVRIVGLGSGSLQGDTAFVHVLGRMGCEVTVTESWVEIRRNGPLVGIDVDLADMSDQAPTLAVVAAFAESPTRIEGIGFIRFKESDRVGGTVTELRRLGVDAIELPDGIEVRPGAPMKGATVQTYDDHRMAMAFALAGLVVPGVRIADPGCVAKTFPGYWEAVEELGRSIT